MEVAKPRIFSLRSGDDDRGITWVDVHCDTEHTASANMELSSTLVRPAVESVKSLLRASGVPFAEDRGWYGYGSREAEDGSRRLVAEVKLFIPRDRKVAKEQLLAAGCVLDERLEVGTPAWMKRIRETYFTWPY